MPNTTAFRALFALCAVLVVRVCRAQCPDSDDLIEPCVCEQRILSCGSELTLPRLAAVLGKGLCGRHLDRFELREANISYLPSDLFLKTSVKAISVSHMGIARFTAAGTSAFQEQEDTLESLSMRHCSQVNRLDWQMISPMRALMQLDLSYNNLTRIPVEWFRRPPPRLRSLVLKGNRISALEFGALTFLNQLVELDLSENRISQWTRSSLPRPANALIFLRLSYNRLQDVPDDLFDEMMSIRRIYLDRNWIQTLGTEETWSAVWGDLHVLDLSGNPVECSCEAQWISKLRPPRLLYGECHSPADLQGTPLKSLQPDHFHFCGVDQ